MLLPLRSSHEGWMGLDWVGVARQQWHSQGNRTIRAGEVKMAGVKRIRDGDVGLLTLDEPSTLNAMTPDLLGDLAAAVDEMTGDAGGRALVLTGAGRGFCSGQNLRAFDSLGSDIVAGVMRHYWPAMRALRECRVPIVVAVYCVAGGGGVR